MTSIAQRQELHTKHIEKIMAIFDSKEDVEHVAKLIDNNKIAETIIIYR